MEIPLHPDTNAISARSQSVQFFSFTTKSITLTLPPFKSIKSPHKIQNSVPIQKFFFSIRLLYSQRVPKKIFVKIGSEPPNWYSADEIIQIPPALQENQ